MRYLFLVCFFMSFVAFGQEELLLKVNDEHITTEDFVRVYEKNLALIKDSKDNSPEQYLDLYVDYKLKVQEAKKRGLHNKASYKNEIASYKSQLAKDYLNDVVVTDKLVQEAYYRTKNELRARHILIRVRPDALPKDTLAAYNQVLEARKRITGGEDFTTIARAYSQDPSVKRNGGDLGWFKAFKMVYPFENEAYNAPIGKVSQPFRTSFGYHIVQPMATRISQGAVQVAHIMIALKQKDTTIKAAAKINEVNDLLEKGVAFKTLVLNYSDDKNSAKKGGLLSPFEKGQLSSATFEDVAFSLDSIGATSKPFKTKFGWHILKLVKKNPLQSFEEMRPLLTKRVTKDARARVISQELNARLREQYQITQEPVVINYFKIAFPEVYDSNFSILTSNSTLDKNAFTIGSKPFTYNDIAQVLQKKYNKAPYASKDYFVNKEVKIFIDNALTAYHKSHLEEQDEDFRLLIKEYKEGLLLFDLLQSEIWDKAQKDSVGLQTFFNKNAKHYKKQKTYRTRVITTPQKKIANAYLKKNTARDNSKSVITLLKKKYDAPVIVTIKDIAATDLLEIKNLSIGDKKLVKESDSFVIYEVIGVNDAKMSSLQEVRGQVMSDYQKHLEDVLVERLREESEITVNSSILNKLMSKYVE